jgi:predicted RNA methylase
MALEPVLRSRKAGADLRVLDLSCGCGHFLVPAAERLAGRAGACVIGVDSDPVAVEICRGALRRVCRGVQFSVICADGLTDALPGEDRGFDVIVGNPPFLNRLERHAAVDRALAARLRARFGAGARAYTDLSALFLLRSVRLARKDGRVALVQPQSVLSSRDAAGVRDEVLGRAAMTDLWMADEHAFDASVFVCVPVFRVGKRTSGRIQRTRGRTFSRLPEAAPDPAGASWGHLLAWDVPSVRVSAGASIGDLADVFADFRDEYYGLRGLILEARTRDASRFPKLVTTGLIDAASCKWGRTQCRFDRQAWQTPRVDLARLKTTTDLGAWAASRLRPKLLLATQTRVLEVAPDEEGETLPVTPLISVLPRSARDIWLVGAALASPAASAIAARIGAGSAMTHRAIKLSAMQVRGLPAPARGPAWREGATLFRQACGASDADRPGLLARSGSAMCAAYGVKKTEIETLMRWWTERASIARQATRVIE